MRNLLITCTLIIAFFSNSIGQKAPAAVTSAIIVKILPFEKSINSSGELVIYVIGAPDVVADLNKIIGKKVGGLTIKSIDSGDKLPSAIPSAIFIDDPKFAESVNKYAKTNKIVTITRNKGIQKDITIAIELTEDGKPLILINPSASKSQDLEWNPAIFKIAKKLE